MNVILYEFNYWKLTFLFPVIFTVGPILIVGSLVFIVKKIKNLINPDSQRQIKDLHESELKKGAMSELYQILAYLILISCLGCIPTSRDYIKAATAFKNNTYQIVEGYVQNFKPPKNSMRGTPPESFNINDTHFSYSEGIISCGYNRTWHNNGVIKNNYQHLKIGYVETRNGNTIVYIEQLNDDVQLAE